MFDMNGNVATRLVSKCTSYFYPSQTTIWEWWTKDEIRMFEALFKGVSTRFGQLTIEQVSRTSGCHLFFTRCTTVPVWFWFWSHVSNKKWRNFVPTTVRMNLHTWVLNPAIWHTSSKSFHFLLYFGPIVEYSRMQVHSYSRGDEIAPFFVRHTGARWRRKWRSSLEISLEKMYGY